MASNWLRVRSTRSVDSFMSFSLCRVFRKSAARMQMRDRRRRWRGVTPENYAFASRPRMIAGQGAGEYRPLCSRLMSDARWAPATADGDSLSAARHGTPGTYAGGLLIIV